MCWEGASRAKDTVEGNPEYLVSGILKVAGGENLQRFKMPTRTLQALDILEEYSAP